MFHKDANSRVASEMRNIEYRSRKGEKIGSRTLQLPPMGILPFRHVSACLREIFQNPFRYKRDRPIIFYSATQFATESYLHFTNDRPNVKIAHEFVANYPCCTCGIYAFIKSHCSI